MLSEMLFEIQVAGNFCSGTWNQNGTKNTEGFCSKIVKKIPASFWNILQSFKEFTKR